jgi:hypothetical protein
MPEAEILLKISELTNWWGFLGSVFNNSLVNVAFHEEWMLQTV